MKRLTVGLIGLGEVAQVTHLPVLDALAERYAISAICDISPSLLAHIGTRYGISQERRFSDYRDLVALSDLDVVFVLNSDEYHAECTIAAVQQGKHVLVEKPMCLTQREADAIIEARDAAGVQVMVGYMRRYAPAFLEAVQQVRQLDKINYVRVRDIIGAHRFFTEQSSSVLYPKDIPQDAQRDRVERARLLAHEALGEQPSELYGIYRLLCGLSSHDLSAMREMLGAPQRVVAAMQIDGGHFLNAIFAYDGFQVMFETGIDGIRRVDAHIEVYGQHKSIRVQYDSPYIRHLPVTLQIFETAGEAYNQQVIRPTFTDFYTWELLAFYDTVVKRTLPKTSPEDFKHDLALFKAIIEKLDQSAV